MLEREMESLKEWKDGADIDAELKGLGKADRMELDLYRLRTALQQPNGVNKETLHRYHENLVLSGNINAALDLRSSEIWINEFHEKGFDRVSARLISGQIVNYTTRLKLLVSQSPHEFALYLSGLKRHNRKTYDNLSNMVWSFIDDIKFKNRHERTSLFLAMERFEGYNKDLTKSELIWLFDNKVSGTLGKLFQSDLKKNQTIFNDFIFDILIEKESNLSTKAICRILTLGYALLDEATYERLLHLGKKICSLSSIDRPDVRDSLNKITSAFLSHKTGRKYRTRKHLRIAVCVSGQLRGYIKAFETWRHLNLQEHSIKYFVHTWDDIGWRFPDPISGNGVDRIFKHRPFAQAYRAAGFQYGIEALRNAYPRFFSALNISSTASIQDIKSVYGPESTVIIEDHNSLDFGDDTNNQRKMFYKIKAAHDLINEDGEDYDLVIRIRPDRTFREGPQKPNWASMAKELSKGRIIFLNNHRVTEGGLYVGDQFAIGTPYSMECYANTLALQDQAIAEKWFEFPQRLRPHASLAHALLFQGARCRPFEGIYLASPQPAAEYNRAETKQLLSTDLPSGPITEMDHLLWNSLS